MTNELPSPRELELVEEVGQLLRRIVDQPVDHERLWQDLDKRLAELRWQSPHDLDD